MINCRGYFRRKYEKRQFSYLLLLACMWASPCLRGQCTDDCLWPGDLNANGIVNSLDILSLGFGLDRTGPPRANTATDWLPINAENWPDSPIFGVNPKHVDADGDGEITELDRLVVSINYQQTNDSFTGLLGNELSGDDLFLIADQTTFTPGASIFVDVHLGRQDAPINNIYGIAFELEMDTALVENVLFDFSDSWLGTDEEWLAYGKFDTEIDHAGFGLTRVDRMPVSGFGPVARMEIIITDVILGLEADTTACIPFPLRFKNVLGVDTSETDLLITAREDSLQIKHPSQLTNATNGTWTEELIVFPNPSQETVYIRSTTEAIQSIHLLDTQGRRLRQWNTENDTTITGVRLDLSAFPPGIYWLSMRLQDRFIRRKIVKL